MDIPLIQAYQPATFLERGVAVPFTTPLLAGTRARPSERVGTELLVPNPSGGTGVYILPWASLRDFCRPTLHDTRLNELVSEIEPITPLTIRRAADDIAAEGLAGRAARQAVRAHSQEEQHARLLANFQLLLELVRQNEPSGLHAVPPDREMPAMLERRARVVITRVAPGLGTTLEDIATALEQLATHFSAIGIGQDATNSRHGRGKRALAALYEEAMAWTEAPDDTSRMHAKVLADAAALTLACARTVIGHVRGMTGNMLQLLRDWQTDAEEVKKLTTRPDWLLDGWDQIISLWRDAEGEAAKRAALAEIALIVPVLPREVTQWTNNGCDMDFVLRHRRMVLRNQDWRTGVMVFDLIARNERVRALNLRDSYVRDLAYGDIR